MDRRAIARPGPTPVTAARTPARARTTADPWMVIDGRRWRVSDPELPEAVRQELVDELMAARRAVGAGKRAGDLEAVTSARARVQDAKVALGERGARWWEEPAPAELEGRAAAARRSLGRHRGDEASVTESEVTRIVAGSG